MEGTLRLPPTRPADHELLCRVLAEHSLTAAELAAATGYHPSFISRVQSGQYAIPASLLRAVWDRTGDHRVARLALGDRALDDLRAGPADQRLVAAVSASGAIGRVADGLARFAAGRGEVPSLRRDIATALRALRVIDSHLQPKVDLVA